MPRCAQSVYEVFEHQKSDLLRDLLKNSADFPQVLVFLQSRKNVHEVTAMLNRAGISVESIHGTTKPELRTRAIEDLKSGTLQVVVSTNAVVQDFDLAGISKILYFEFHERDEDYLARLESTEVESIVLVTQENQNQLKKLEALVGEEIPRKTLAEFPYDTQPKYVPPVRTKGYRPNKTGSKPLQHKKPKLKNKGPRRKTGRTRKR